MPKATRLCDLPDCDRKHLARGLCRLHWKREHGKPTRYPITCATCGEEATSSRADGRFCDDDCKGLWYSEAGVRPPAREPRISRLPSDHQVIALIREMDERRAQIRSTQSMSPHRQAYEAQDWQGLVSALRALTVECDTCWLWNRKVDKRGYGSLTLKGKWWAAHRLMAYAANDGQLDGSMAVHHTCAEPMCINPDHLQVIQPHLNVAEMVERSYYTRRIAELEQALSELAPGHPALRSVQLRAA